MASFKYEAASIATLLSTELNSLANGSAALGAEYNNSSNLYLWGAFELAVTFGSAPTAGSLINLYFEIAADGSNYSDDQSISSAYIGGFPLRNVTSAQRVPLALGMSGPIWLPPTKFKVRAVNNSGQSFPSSGSTIKMVPHRLQSA